MKDFTKMKIKKSGNCKKEYEIMKLSFSTLSFDECSFEDMAKLCKKYGYDGIEIRMGSGVGAVDYTEQELSEIRKMLDSYGVSVVGLGSSVCPRDNSEENYEGFVKLLPMAKALGANGIRVFTGTFKGRRSQPNNPLNYDGLVTLLQRLSDEAKKYGVCVYIETHNDFSTGKDLKRLLASVNRDNCKIIWDIMHPLEEFEEPQQTMDYLGKSVAHVHVKDGYKPDDPDVISYTYCPIGEGDIPIGEIVSVLKKGGYDGYYSLEWEEQWRESLKQLDMPHEEVLKRYAEYMREVDSRTEGE